MAVLFVNVLLKKKKKKSFNAISQYMCNNKVSCSSRYFGFRNAMVLTKSSELCSAPVSSKLSFFSQNLNKLILCQGTSSLRPCKLFSD